MSDDYAEFPHGYRDDLEDLPSLIATERRFEAAELFSASLDRPIDNGVREKVKGNIVVEGQSQTSSCCGHTGSYIAELNRGLETGDWSTQLSRWGCYILAQIASGISGDRGAFIQAMCKSGSAQGYGLESLWKFTGKYHTKPPCGMEKYLADAAQRKLGSWKVLKNYADLAMWFQTGQGGVAMGVPWFTNWYNGVSGIMPKPAVKRGMHAYALFWPTARTEGSRYYLEGPNSWTKSWGNQGWAEWSPSLIDWLFKQPGAVFVGMSDLTNDDRKVRAIDYRKESAFLRKG